MTRHTLLLSTLALLMGCPADEPAGPSPEECDNEIDDDGDGDVDCDDADCALSCIEICDNGVDDDGNGLIDCADEPCFSPSCAEVCGDGLDNDLDTRIDCDDTECIGLCPEICNDSIDNDGDGAADCVDDDCIDLCDADQDGYFSVQAGYDDCDDDDPNVNPAADEVCNGIDDDCDGDIDGDDSNLAADQTWFRDDDGDGYGTGDQGLLTCEPPEGTAPTNEDCDDDDPDRNPDAEEVCNGRDDNCDRLVDEDDPSLDPASLNTYYVDADGDGAGDEDDPGIEACVSPDPELVTTGGDCDDNDPAPSPTHPEVLCDGFDNDCDPATLDDSGDSDGDGFDACVDDCDDTNADVNPSATEEECNGLDDDCDPSTVDEVDADGDGLSCLVDCDDNDPKSASLELWGEDGDGDGYAEAPGIESCVDPGGAYIQVEVADDCDDGDAQINPGARDQCNDGIDQDCSGTDYTPCDTAAEIYIRGEATVDLIADTLLGEESLVIEGRDSGHIFCDFVFDSIDWESDPSVGGNPPFNTNTCTDFDGNPCAFAFAVNMNDPEGVDGDCALFGLTPAYPSITRGWGFHPDYRANGLSYGPLPMYYFAAYGEWYGLLAPASFDQLTGLFTYEAYAGPIGAPY